MPVVRPHNRQKKQRKKNGQKDKQQSKKNQKKDQTYSDCTDDEAVDSVFGEKIGTTQIPNKNKQSKLNSKKTIKKGTMEQSSIIKEFKKRLKHYSEQYTPTYLLDILGYLIQKQRRDTMGIGEGKIARWRQIRKNEVAVQQQLRRQVERIRQVITKQRSDATKLQKGDNSSSNPNLKSKNELSTSSYFVLRNEPLRFQYADWQQKNRFNTFAVMINQILICCEETQLPNCIYPSCYIFYMFVVSDGVTFNEMQKQLVNCSGRNQELLQYYFSVSLFIASKYHEVHPISIEQLIYEINETLTLRKAEKIELIAMELNDFREFYSDHEGKYLDTICLLINWSLLQKNVCQFILQSGLNNPFLYQYSPIHKAVVAVGIYEDRYYGKQEKYHELRNLFEGPSVQLGKQIRKHYLNILQYNVQNELNYQKQKHFIFAQQRRKILEKEQQKQHRTDKI